MDETRFQFYRWTRPGYEYSLRVLRHLFIREDIEGKHVLDIGAGCGETSGAFILEFGAERATAVDSYEGHGSDASTYEEIIGLKNILGERLEVVRCDIMDFSTAGKYGFIVNKSSLHHIAESKTPLERNAELYEKVVGLFKKFGSWLEDDGKLVIMEVSRRNWSPIPTYRRRFKEVVDVTTKQDPWTWLSVLKKAGFRNVRLRYPPPVVLDRFKFLHPLFNNYLMSILTGSTYLIEASCFRDKKEG